MVSLSALIERVVEQFDGEHGAESEQLRLNVTRPQKLSLLREVVLYICGVESVSLNDADLAELTLLSYAEIFGYAGLDPLLDDPEVTTITFEGTDKVSVRRGRGDLVTVEPVFDSSGQLWRVIRRLMRDAGAELRPDLGIYELGLTVNGRKVALNLVTPPVSVLFNADIRVHPRQPVTLDMLMPNADVRALLTRIARSEHGVLVVGEPESGKTSALSALLEAGQIEDAIAVERAGELTLLDLIERLLPRWPLGELEGIGFSDRIAQAAEHDPKTLILDEVRADDPTGVMPLLGADMPVRQMWAFRGAAESKRLSAALGMLARRADPDQTHSDMRVQRLFQRLPFVVFVKRRREAYPQIIGVAEWQFLEGVTQPPSLIELAAMDWEGVVLTGREPSRSL
jgi:type IV secretory pathway ATPase VirB11/archaellum biosynthesis ATPase